MERSPEEHCRILSTTTRTYYNSVKIVFCPALKKDVVFNAKGFHHLNYRPYGKPRSIPERIHKLTLVPLAVPVIKSATRIYEERDIHIPGRRKDDSKSAAVRVKQYALVATVGKKKPITVKVIIQEVENSKNPIFWSIMRH